jgi:hypothetical protein
MDKEIQDMLNDLPNKKFAKYSDAKLEAFENHKLFMSGPNNPFRGKPGSLKGKTFSDEHKRKIGEKHKGKIVSKETLEKMSIVNKGKKLSKETVEKMSKSMMGVNKGKKHSQETKDKLSILKKGTKLSEEGRKKLSEAQKKRTNHFNEEAIKNRRAKTLRPILCYSVPDMVFICEYESITQASKKLNIDMGGIGKILNGTIKEPRKYFFKYKEV